MLSDCRDDGSDVSKDLRTLEGAEGSRDFHAQLHHAQVLFGLIVGEGHCEVRKEPRKRRPRPIDFRLSACGAVKFWRI